MRVQTSVLLAGAALALVAMAWSCATGSSANSGGGNDAGHGGTGKDGGGGGDGGGDGGEGGSGDSGSTFDEAGNCTNGGTVCGSTCIGSNACCTNTDCPTEPNSTMTECSAPGGKCLLTCTANCFDTNGVFTDGCECCADMNDTCGGGDPLGPVALGGMTTATGLLPGPGSADWFIVTFSGQTDLTFHPGITVTGDKGIVFDVYSACPAGSGPADGGLIEGGVDAGITVDAGDAGLRDGAVPPGPAPCSMEGGTCVGKTSWDTQYTCGTGVPPCSPTQPNFVPIPFGTAYIKVYRTSGTPDCKSFTLNATN
jgi:hypothetical protein